MNGWTRRWVALIAGFGISAAMAQAPSAPSAATPAPPSAIGTTTAAPALTAADLGAFLDGLMPFALRPSDIAGGVVVVIKEGKVLFARGYGYANLARRACVTTGWSARAKPCWRWAPSTSAGSSWPSV